IDEPFGSEVAEPVASEIAEPVVSEVVEPFVSESVYEESSVPTFATLPEMPITPQSLDIELSDELASLEPSPVAKPTPMALGVDVHDLAGPSPTAPDPVAETSSVVDDLTVAEIAPPRLPEPETSAPSLMIEESDPLGLLSGEGLDSGGETALDA